MAQRDSRQDASLVVSDDQPLIGITLVEDGRETVHYFCSERDADDAVSATATRDALALAGAWADLDWTDLEEGLDRIRHQTPPSPPLAV